jgi:hypothetical protein
MIWLVEDEAGHRDAHDDAFLGPLVAGLEMGKEIESLLSRQANDALSFVVPG